MNKAIRNVALREMKGNSTFLRLPDCWPQFNGTPEAFRSAINYCWFSCAFRLILRFFFFKFRTENAALCPHPDMQPLKLNRLLWRLRNFLYKPHNSPFYQNSGRLLLLMALPFPKIHKTSDATWIYINFPWATSTVWALLRPWAYVRNLHISSRHAFPSAVISFISGSLSLSLSLCTYLKTSQIVRAHY